MRPEEFYGRATRLAPAALANAANGMGVEVEVLEAIMRKESRGSGYNADGRPVILYEPYQFHKQTQGKYDKTHPDVSVADRKNSNYGAPGAHQYDRLTKAIALDEEAALKATSWGFWQCMGFNYADLEYTTVQDLVRSFAESEQCQLDAWIKFLKVKGLIPAMQTKDWATIAYKMNGSAYRENHYDEDIKTFYYQLCNPSIIQNGSVGSKVTTLQKLLCQQGYKEVVVSGIFDDLTEVSLRDFQASHGLTVDGKAGAESFAALAAAKVEPTSVSGSKRGLAGVATAIMGTSGVGTAISGLLQQPEKQAQVVQTASQVAAKVAAAPPAAKPIVAAQAASQAADVAKEVTSSNTNYLIIILVLSIILIVLAAFIVWTKIHDNKKLKG